MCSSTGHNVPASPQKYRVAIIETLRRIVDVEADDSDQAEQIVSDGWHRSEYILGAEDFAEVEFEAVVGEQGNPSLKER